MSFSTTTKNEITTLNHSKSERIAFLSGFVRNNGYIQNDNLCLTTENKNIVKMLVEYFENLYDVKINVKETDNLNLFKNKLNLLMISEKVDFILQDIAYFDKESKYLETIPNYIVGANEEIRAYLRGVFLSSGSINDPSSSYHLELTIDKKDEAVFVQPDNLEPL